tara:strand:+ start:758 stop:925 length:168 start_codon:yes stop_codon:yes gene_type:complete
MCIICVDLAKGKLTRREALGHLREFSESDEITERHGEVILEEIRRLKEMGKIKED